MQQQILDLEQLNKKNKTALDAQQAIIEDYEK